MPRTLYKSVRGRIDAWKKVQPGVGADLWMSSGQPKTIMELFRTVHEICDFVPKEPAGIQTLAVLIRSRVTSRKHT